MLDVVTIDSVDFTIAQLRKGGQKIDALHGEAGSRPGNKFPIEIGEDGLTALRVEGLEEGGTKETIVMAFVLVLNEVTSTLDWGKGSETAKSDEVAIADRATDEDVANVVVQDGSGWSQELIQQQRTGREREIWEGWKRV